MLDSAHMKSSKKFSILLLTGSAFMMSGVFAKPLGIPSHLEGIPTLIGIICIYIGYRAQRKEVATGQIPMVPDPQKRKRFALMVALCAVTCAAMPFILPFTGVVLPFTKLIIISVVSFFICIGAVWLGTKMRV